MADGAFWTQVAAAALGALGGSSGIAVFAWRWIEKKLTEKNRKIEEALRKAEERAEERELRLEKRAEELADRLFALHSELNATDRRQALKDVDEVVRRAGEVVKKCLQHREHLETGSVLGAGGYPTEEVNALFEVIISTPDRCEPFLPRKLILPLLVLTRRVAYTMRDTMLEAHTGEHEQIEALVRDTTERRAREKIAPYSDFSELHEEVWAVRWCIRGYLSGEWFGEERHAPVLHRLCMHYGEAKSGPDDMATTNG